MQSVEVDVLIVGGGSQGLWLLNDLDRAGYRSILVEQGELGGGQTCHSHALIHRGHYYDDPNMMVLLNASAQFWEGFIKRADVPRLNQSRALVGLGPGDEQRYRNLWDSAGLRYSRLQTLPLILQKSRVSHIFETEEFSVDAHTVVSRLAETVDHCLYKSDEGEPLSFVQNGRSVTEVNFFINSTSVSIRPTMVVLCAGGQNLALLDQLGASRDGDGHLLQARRQSTMLCLRSPELPPLTAVFPVKGGVKGLFICSRKCPVTSQTVWLVSDHNSLAFNPGVGDDGNFDPFPQNRVVNRIIESLVACVPAFEASQMTDLLEACVYTGLTSERDLGSGDHMTDCYIETFSFDNVITIWPTKLTLTPFASNIAMRVIRTKLSAPLGNESRKLNRWPEIGYAAIPPSRPKVAKETWQKNPFQTPEGSKSEWGPLSMLQ